MRLLEDLLKESAALHNHLCPRQVLGVRMGLMAEAVFQLELPQTGKRLLTIAETDGCTVGGVSVATGCTVGHRTLRIEDYGKVAATFVDTHENRAIRLVPRRNVRDRAYVYAPSANSKWESYLIGYQHMPAEELFLMQEVELTTPLRYLLSKAGVKTSCVHCGEEIINEREVMEEGKAVCKACAGDAYYRLRINKQVMEAEQCEAV